MTAEKRRIAAFHFNPDTECLSIFSIVAQFSSSEFMLGSLASRLRHRYGDPNPRATIVGLNLQSSP